MKSTLARSLKLVPLLAIITCGIYPLCVTLFGQLLFPKQSTGSIIHINNRPVGALLIGQKFTAPKYFHGRPSAAGNEGYDAVNSAGSNLGPTSKTLQKNIEQNIQQILEQNPNVSRSDIPTDLVTASASGLDPHISPKAAELQIPRIAKIRNASESDLKKLIERHTEKPFFRILGEPVVNVMLLNLALDGSQGSL